MRRFALALLVLLVAADAAYAEAKSVIFTIGRTAAVSSGFACKNREAAIAVANLIRDQGSVGAMQNAITADYVVHGICGILGSSLIMPLSVTYNVAIPEGKLLKVLVVATVWPPKPETNFFLLGSNTVIGSGIRKVSEEGSI